MSGALKSSSAPNLRLCGWELQVGCMLEDEWPEDPRLYYGSARRTHRGCGGHGASWIRGRPTCLRLEVTHKESLHLRHSAWMYITFEDQNRYHLKGICKTLHIFLGTLRNPLKWLTQL